MFQPQNLPRPSLEQDQIEEGIEALKAGCADLLFDNIMELTSSALRGCIMAPAGKKLVVSDLSNIEGRKLAWLAGEQWKLDAFREYDEGTGPDLYKLAYARAFNISPDDVDKYQRQIGKVMELGLGFGGGVAAFLTFALVYGLDLDELANAALPNIPRDVIREAKSWYDESVKRKSTFGLSERVFIACDSLKRLWRRAHPGERAGLAHAAAACGLGRETALHGALEDAWLAANLLRVLHGLPPAPMRLHGISNTPAGAVIEA